LFHALRGSKEGLKSQKIQSKTSPYALKKGFCHIYLLGYASSFTKCHKYEQL
jgi:hypothetical protein